MEINADFTKRVLIHTDELEWSRSPMPGVSRRMLDRVGDEVARATSIVRYAPKSHFSPHIHGGGEEFLVLEGVFQDEHGDFPAGSYLRNPPTTSHRPGSQDGCVIFVKLHQFDPDDRAEVRCHPGTGVEETKPNPLGIARSALHRDAREVVCIERWSPGVEADLDTEGGAELLLLEGELREGADRLRPGSWLRLPAGVAARAQAGAAGARFFLKRGHLRYVDQDLAHLRGTGGHGS